MNDVNDTMNRAMETLARLDTWLVLIVCGWLVLVWLAPHLARLMRYVKRSILTGASAARFDARTGSEPREPREVDKCDTPTRARVDALASSSPMSAERDTPTRARVDPPPAAPAGRPDPAPDYPSVWQVLAKMIVAGAISTSEAYRLLGVSRGGSARYQTAAATLAAAVAAERKVNYPDGERSDTFTVSEHGRPVRTLRKADDDGADGADV
jgi:hypothetical protein